MISFSLPETFRHQLRIFKFNIRPRLDHFGVRRKERKHCPSFFSISYRYIFMGDIFTARRTHNTHRNRESTLPWEESCAYYLGTYSHRQFALSERWQHYTSMACHDSKMLTKFENVACKAFKVLCCFPSQSSYCLCQTAKTFTERTLIFHTPNVIKLKEKKRRVRN